MTRCSRNAAWMVAKVASSTPPARSTPVTQGAERSGRPLDRDRGVDSRSVRVRRQVRRQVRPRSSACSSACSSTDLPSRELSTVSRMAQTADVPLDVAPELVDRIPGIVDLDAHVVEPPDIWTARLPPRYRDVGPHVEYHPMGTPQLAGGTYVEAPGTEGPPIAWWCYEDHRYSVKRLIAAAGYPADEISLGGITFDEMRPGCWQPRARLADMDVNGVDAQMSFPNYPRFCGQIFLGGRDRELAELCVRAVQRLDGRGVVRRQRRPPDPVVPDPPVGRRARGRRGAAQRGARRARRRLQRAADVPRPPEHLQRPLGPVLPRPARRPARFCACTSGRRR